MNNKINNLYFYLFLIVPIIIKADGPNKALNLMQAIANKDYPSYVRVIDQAVMPILPFQLKKIQNDLVKNNFEQARNELNFLLRNYNYIPGLERCGSFYEKAKEYGSGGRLGKVKIFPERIENFFIGLFNAIVHYGNEQEFLLVADDLFHGHVVLLHDQATHFSDIVIVFHAKEFPADLPEAGGFKNRASSPVNFNMRDDRAFSKRNFIYSFRSHVLVNLQKDAFGKDYQSYRELITEYDPRFDLEVNTLREHYFGQTLFDINYFPNLYGFAKDVSNPGKCPILFAY